MGHIYVHKVFLDRLSYIDKIKSLSKSSGLSKEYFICYSRLCTGPDIFAMAYRCLCTNIGFSR